MAGKGPKSNPGDTRVIFRTTDARVSLDAAETLQLFVRTAYGVGPAYSSSVLAPAGWVTVNPHGLRLATVATWVHALAPITLSSLSSLQPVERLTNLLRPRLPTLIL